MQNNPPSICLNSGYSFFSKLSTKHKDILIYKKYPKDDEKTRLKKNKLFRQDNEFCWDPYYPFKVSIEPPKYFANLELFIRQLLKCDEQLFHKLSCYFQSPTRIVEGKQSVILNEPLEDLRVSDKIPIDHCKEKRPQLEMKTKWIKTLLKEGFGECKTNPPNFELEPGLVFTMGDDSSSILYSNEKNRFIALYSKAPFYQMQQLFYTFPSMLIQKVVNNPDEPIDVSFCCVIVGQSSQFHTCLGKFKKESRLSEIEIELSISSCSIEERIEQPFSWISLYIDSIVRKTVLNFCNEAVKYSEVCKKHKLQLKQFYDVIFKKVSAKKTTRKPKPSHLEFVKQQSENILRDVTNTYNNIVIQIMNTKSKGSLTKKLESETKP